MLIALLTIFFLGGGDFGPITFIGEASDNVKTAIVDADKRKEVSATLKAAKSRSKDYVKEINGLSKSLRKRFADHDVSDEDLDGYWSQAHELNLKYSEDLVDIRFALRDQVTREEWEGLFPAE